ncbi:type II toxin-antitoxin system VapC family toxin [Glycocaulis sp.]|uniref:type II toxin-antitoxin system VapC family toxin n=1 Tax=Glycocaulis sp. TaxID=1969725 RepID=UPI003F70321B
MNQLLCDTHSAVWWFAGVPQLSIQAQRRIEKADTVFLSFASVWEMSIKIGKLGANRSTEMDRLFKMLKVGKFAEGFELLAPTIDDYIDAGLLPRHHADPFDRLLIAQALNRNLPIVSTDRALDAYGVTRIW